MLTKILEKKIFKIPIKKFKLPFGVTLTKPLKVQVSLEEEIGKPLYGIKYYVFLRHLAKEKLFRDGPLNLSASHQSSAKKFYDRVLRDFKEGRYSAFAEVYLDVHLTPLFKKYSKYI